MKSRLLGALALVFVLGGGAQAAGLEEAVEAALADWAKSEEAKVSHGGITVNGDQVIIKDMKLNNDKTGFIQTVAEVTASGVKQVDGGRLSATDIRATGITAVRPSGDDDKGKMNHLAIESFDMKGGNILGLLPSVTKDDQTQDDIARILASESHIDSLTMSKLKFGRGRTKDQEPYDSGFESLEVKGLRKGSIDSAVVRNMNFEATEKNPAITIDSINWTSTDRIKDGPATKFNLAVNKVHIVALEKSKMQVTMVLGKDNLTMDMTLAAVWDVKGKIFRISPLTLDSADQAKIDLELLITGFPTPEEIEAARNPETKRIKLNPLVENMGADNLTIRIQERGLAGRLLQMGAMMSGAGDKDKLIAMIEQQGKPQLSAFFGPETAEQVISSVSAFLKQGGTLTLEAKGKAGPLGGAGLMGLAMIPQSAGKLLDLSATHGK